MVVATKHLALSMTLLLVMLWGQMVGAQSNGDLRLIEGSVDKIDGFGRLEIYLDGEWGTFCAKGKFDSIAGDIACQQLGSSDSYSYEVMKASDVKEIPLASNSTPIHTVDNNECVDPQSGCKGALHILRCLTVDYNPDPSCTHDDDVIVMCSLWDLDSMDSYDTQLFLNSNALNSTYRSSGVLEIYSSISQGGAFSGWHNICGTKFDQNAANTACRQLGYTGALSYSTHANRSRDADIWLDGVTCGVSVYGCLDRCFCYPPTLTAVQCDPGNVVALTCTFNLAEKYESFGIRSICEEEFKTFCAPDPDTHKEMPLNLIIVSTVLSAIIVLLSLVVVGLMVAMWNCRGRFQYQTIN